jgi:hypothetical protein
VYIPVEGEFMYTVATSSSTSTSFALLRFDMSTHAITVLFRYTLHGVTGFGAQYGMNNGTLFGSDNGSGLIYNFPLDGSAPFVAPHGPSSSDNDGARCVLNLSEE